MKARPNSSNLWLLLAGLLLCGNLMAGQSDPFAANNTLYPEPAKWPHGMRPSNYAYPVKQPEARWLWARPPGRLTTQNAPTYVAAVKRFIEDDIRGLVNEPLRWSPFEAGWYDMPWGGQGLPMSNGKIDPTSGREALLGSYTGQILQPDSYPSNKPAKAFQNHAVVYYNDVAAHQLGKVWRDPFHPDLTATQFPEGSIVVKVEAATLDEKDWSVLKDSSVSYVYRPSVDSLLDPKIDPTQRKPEVTSMRFLQMAVRVKDRQAAPETGWVFIAFAYNANASGGTVWERTQPVGAMWGNDPQLAGFEDGRGGQPLQQTWIAPDLPAFIRDGLGWGGRLAGPLDLGLRHNVVTVSGKRFGPGGQAPALPSSSCVSCHSAAQYPFVANLYPSPNMSFPPEGGQFLLYDPGSPQWAQWFQNLPGDEALSGRGHRGIVGIDYDMMLTFAMMRANGSADTDAFIRDSLRGH